MGDSLSIPETCSQLIQRNSHLWQAATHHPFLNEIKSGVLSESAFATWLVQDYHFASKLLTGQSLILAQAPRADQKVLIAGLAALDAELEWFEDNAKKLKLDLNEELRPTCKAYADFLLALRHEPYAVQISSLWAVERAYLDAWTTALPCQPKYREFVERWTTLEFGQYVEKLEAVANRALAVASRDERAAALISFRWVARYECDFWQMAFGT